MNKSPLSQMSGNRGYQKYSSPIQGNSRQWLNHNKAVHDNLGVDNSAQNSNNYQNTRNYQANGGSDFIPFETSSPMSQRSYGDKRQGPQRFYSGGYNNCSPNNPNSPRFNQNSPRFHQNSPRFQQNSPRFHQNSPRFHQNSSYSPYQRSNRQNYGNKTHQNSYKKAVDIKKYLDLESMFENPWAELEEQFDLKMKNSSLSADSASECLTDKTDVSDLSQDMEPSPDSS